MTAAPQATLVEPKAQAAQARPDVSPSTAVPSPEFLRCIGHEFARRHLVLSAGRDNQVEQLLAAPQTKATAILNVATRLGTQVTTQTTDAETLASAIDRVFAAAAHGGVEEDTSTPRITIEGSGDVDVDLDLAVRDAEADLLRTDGKAPAIRLVDLIVFQALVRGASDVHIQPVRGRTLVRYRLDGVLHTVRELPLSLASSVVSRVKIMARLDVAENRAPQDGRATVNIGGSSRSGRRVDLRVGTLPSTYGERVVMRLLDPARSLDLLSFEGLGMPAAMARRYRAQAARTSGIVLSTGPTGSGKTTTLYATLAAVSADNAGGQARGCELNMMTVEDPVEYDLTGAGLAVSQMQVDAKKLVTFANGLRHILRQDPDVIMVGEIRDEETARIAVQASLTGHLVLSTLHTIDAPSAVVRLVDLGVEPFLVASSLAAVLAQRLVRRVHIPCAGAGCAECLGTGYRGRTGVFELLVVDGPLRKLIARRCAVAEITALAERAGMVPLRDAGAALVKSGVTTAAEVARVIETAEEAA